MAKLLIKFVNDERADECMNLFPLRDGQFLEATPYPLEAEMEIGNRADGGPDDELTAKQEEYLDANPGVASWEIKQ